MVLFGAGGFGLMIIGSSSSSVPTGSIAISLQAAAKSVTTKARRKGSFLSVFMCLVFKVGFAFCGASTESQIRRTGISPPLARPRGRVRKGTLNTMRSPLEDDTKMERPDAKGDPAHSLVFPNFSLVFLNSSPIANNLSA